jgi:hypothetical protein
MMKSREALIARQHEPDWAKRPQPQGLTAAMPVSEKNHEHAMVYDDEETLDNQERLEREIQLLRRNNASLSKLLEDERRRHAAAIERKDYYMRYCIEIRTHLTHVMHAAHAANERALACAETPPPPQTIEAALAAVIAQEPSIMAGPIDGLGSVMRQAATENTAPKDPVRDTPDLFSPGGGP